MEWLERHRSNLAALLVVLVAVAALTVLQIPRRPALQVLSPSLAAGPPPIKVHVVGAVVSPGVYPLPADARMEDALKAAGGPSAGAEVDSLNLATPLRDGQQVVVPAAGAHSAAQSAPSPSPSAPAATASTGKVNLNTATRRELEALPGIGPATADKILDYRGKNGRFMSIEELRDAKLVNAPTYERIRTMVEAR